MDPAPENEPVPVAAAPEMESAPDTAVAEMESAPETAVAEMEPEMEPAPETAVAKNGAWEIPAWSKHLRSRRGGGQFFQKAQRRTTCGAKRRTKRGTIATVWDNARNKVWDKG